MRRYPYEVPVFMSDIKGEFFFDRFSKNTQISSFMKILPVGTEFFQADRHDEASSRFPQFCACAYNYTYV